MEAAHVALLRRNLALLEQNLQADDVLEGLYEQGVFSSSDREKCLSTNTRQKKSRAVVELVMNKGKDGYKSFCVLLHSIQPDLKDVLDRSASGEGATHLVYGNKYEIEDRYKVELKHKDEEIAEIKQKFSDVNEQRDDLEKIVEECNSQLDELRQKHGEEMEQETERHRTELEQETERHRTELEQEKIMRCDAEKKYQEEVVHLKQKTEELSKMVERLEELNQALTQNVDQTGVMDEGEQLWEEAGEKPTIVDGCVLSTSSECDISQLVLLQCLHAACGPCLVRHNSEDMTCVCGRSIQLKDGPRDFVRINEKAFENILRHGQICTNCESNQAISYCTDCNDYYCDECQQHHDKIKKNQKHSVHPLDSSTMSIEKWLKEPKCKDHPDHPADVYDMACKRPICTVCALGDHKHGSNTSLKKVADEAKTTLTELIESETTKLVAIKDQVVNVARHGEEFRKVDKDLGRTVIELSNNLATRILHRQKQLQEQIRQSIDVPTVTIRRQMNRLKLAEASVTSTIDYMHRTLKSTTQAELVAVTDAIQRKSAEDQEIELPPEDTRDTRIRVSIQGQTALQELLDTFGCVYTSLADEERGDTQPTVADLTCANHCLKEKLSNSSLAAEAAKRETEAKNQSLQKALVAGNMFVLPEQAEIIVTYPHMTFNKERTNTDFCQINDDGILVNKPARQTRHRQRLRRYWGTCGSSLLPLPTSPSTVPPAAQYWEVHVRVEKSEMWCLNLELGVCGEESLDRKVTVYGDSHSWVMAGDYCDKHETACVAPFMAGERGECCLSLPRESVTTFHYGVVVDVGRGRVGMLDTNNGKVLMSCSAKFNQILIPVFGVYSESFPIKMTLVSGADIAWTPQKKSLIKNILN